MSAAEELLAAMLDTQDKVYQLAEAYGVSRDELNELAGIEAA